MLSKVGWTCDDIANLEVAVESEYATTAKSSCHIETDRCWLSVPIATRPSRASGSSVRYHLRRLRWHRQDGDDGSRRYSYTEQLENRGSYCCVRRQRGSS